MFPKVAIVYLSYHSAPHLDDFIAALEKCTYPKELLSLIVVDNPHPTFGSSEKILREKLESRSEAGLPRVIILPQTKNTGFAGGNNIGIERALIEGAEFVYLHNQDGFMAPNCVEKLVDTMKNDETIGAVQSLILLNPGEHLVNTAGNEFHFLGFGYSGKYRANADSIKKEVMDIGYASGASVLLRAGLIKKYGAFDEDYRLYHEDLEYSLRLRSLGYRIIIDPRAQFFHSYQFSRNPGKYYLMERNRWAFLLTYYRFGTLVLLLPALVATEVAILAFSVLQGWGREKLKACAYCLNPFVWVGWFRKRSKIQKQRTVSDAFLLSYVTAKLEFESGPVDNPIIRSIANPALGLYWRIVKKVIIW